MRFDQRHLLGIEPLRPDEITTLLDLADQYVTLSRRREKHSNVLSGLTQINMFFENSTRTQSSFELAGKRLGADVMNMAMQASSIKKGETLIDTALTLNAMHPDLLVVRHPHSGAVDLLAQKVNCAVLNAGDGRHEHPTQALLDTFTMFEKKGDVNGLNVTILGDILYSRVARSNIWALTKLGANVTLCGPPTLVPRIFEKMGCRVTYNVDEALADADIVNLLRIQHERQRLSAFPSIGEYRALFGLTNERFARLKPDTIVMHPGPMNRGVEIDSEIADHPRSTILDQVTNGLAVRMAVMFLVSGGKSLPEPSE